MRNADGPFPGGYLNKGHIIKDGNTVIRKQVHPWPEAVTGALRTLHVRGVRGCPTVLRRIDESTVILTFIRGEALPDPVPDWASSESLLQEVTIFARGWSNASREVQRDIAFTDWIAPTTIPGPDFVHGDLHPSNIVFSSARRPVGLVDFELAHVGATDLNLASLLFSWTPLEPQAHTCWRQSGHLDFGRRFAMILKVWQYTEGRETLRQTIRAYITWRRNAFMALAAYGNQTARLYISSPLYAMWEELTLTRTDNLMEEL